MCMKLKLTEGQLSKLIVTLDEQETPKPLNTEKYNLIKKAL